MGSPLYRDNGSRRTVSPEQLNDYIKVSSPAAWAVLLGVIVLLAGVCVWGIFGRLETTVQAVAVSDGATVTCYVSEADAQYAEGGTVRTIAAYPLDTFSDALMVDGVIRYYVHIEALDSVLGEFSGSLTD